MFDVDQSGAITVDEIKQILGGKAPGGSQPSQIKLGDDSNSFVPGSDALDPKPNLIDDEEWENKNQQPNPQQQAMQAQSGQNAPQSMMAQAMKKSTNNLNAVL